MMDQIDHQLGPLKLNKHNNHHTHLRFESSSSYNSTSSTPDLITSLVVVPQPSSSSSFPPTTTSSTASSSSSAASFSSSLPFPTPDSPMPSFHLPSPSPYTPLQPFSAPPTSSPICSSLQSVQSKDDSFLSFKPTQEPSSDFDLMARRRTKRYACLPTQALLDSLPTSITPPSSLSQLDLPCLNHLISSEPSPSPSSPPAQLRSSSSNISTSSASLSPDPLFDSQPLPPVPRPRHLTLGRSSHSMMHLEHPSSIHRPKEKCRLSQLYSPNRSFDQRSSWHPPSTPGGTPELTTSPVSTPRPISTAYTTTTTSSSSSPPESFSRRALAIAELIDTETTHARDMAVIRDIYLAKALAEPVEDCLLSPLGKFSHSRPSTATCLPPKALPSSSSPFGSVLNFGARKRAAFKKSPPPKLGLVSQPTSSQSPTLLSPLNPSTPMSPIDRKTVFGNLEEVASLAEAFSGLLAEAGGGGVHDGDSTDSIGACFIEMLPKIEQVFTTYCAKYESANNRLQELTPSLTTYLEECQHLARGRTTAWDLPSLLIKPVQRCLKYPLLLDQILQLTPPGHPDRPQLAKARAGMIAVADSINETKRRYEYIEGIVGSPKPVPCRKPSRRTVAPASLIIAKALSRRSARPSSADGVLAPMINRLHQSKRAVMKLPAVLMAWSVRVREMNEQSGRMANTLKALHLLSSDQPAVTGGHLWFPQNGQPDLRHIDNYLQHVAIAASMGPLKVMEARLRSEIIPLCEQLNKLYQNPMAVIACRDAKEAELAHSPNCSKLRTLIEAIDAQLMTELPRFHAASARFLDGIMMKVAKVQQDLYFDLRVLHWHLAKSFRGDQQYHQDACKEKIQGLSIVSSMTLSRGTKEEDHDDHHHHESYILLDSPPTLTMEDGILGHEHIGIAMTTSSPVPAARYSRRK